MVCRQCGTEIAAKAIICYKCGTATAVPAAAGQSHRPEAGGARGSSAGRWLLGLVVAVAIAAAWYWWRTR